MIFLSLRSAARTALRRDSAKATTLMRVTPERRHFSEIGESANLTEQLYYAGLRTGTARYRSVVVAEH